MNWNDLLSKFMNSDTGKKLKEDITKRREQGIVYPEAKDVFKAFLLTPLSNVKIVILGLDPYNKGGHADGLAFSSKRKERPPSLEIILKELRRDVFFHLNSIEWEQFFPTNDLTVWAQRGVLLLNRYLTVDEGKPKSHADLGWNVLIKEVFQALDMHDQPIVFMLWGNDAKEFAPLIVNKKHLVLTGAHPAADAYNPKEPKFAGCGHFSQAIRFLQENREPIKIDFDIKNYFKAEMFEDFYKVVKSFGYPMLFKTQHDFVEDFRKSLKITYNFGFDFTLSKE